MAARNVVIHVGAQPTCVPDPVYLSKGAGDYAVWTCPQNPNFQVIFPQGTPFSSAKFTQATSNSGVPILTPDHGYTVSFKYLVEVGGNVADPGVIVTE
jgi:hypothetical protein